MGEMDVTAAESKATYQEIQDWVQEKYGFHVTHLNIAKTKRKLDLSFHIGQNCVNGKYFSRKKGIYFSRNAANYFPEFAAFYFPEFMLFYIKPAGV